METAPPPLLLPEPGEPLSDYLFARKGLFWGEGPIHSSTLLVEREVAICRSVRRRSREARGHRLAAPVTRIGGGRVELVPIGEPQAVWNADESRHRASTVPSWRRSLAWIRNRRDLVTPRAYAASS